MSDKRPGSRSENKVLSLQALSKAVKNLVQIPTDASPKWTKEFEDICSVLPVRTIDYLEFLLERLRISCLDGKLPE